MVNRVFGWIKCCRIIKEDIKGMNIAIDGPAGAGKSSIAKRVAKELSYVYVDTGAMYRTIALYFIQKGIDLEDESAVSAGCDAIDIVLQYQDGAQIVLLNGEDVSTAIRQEEVGAGASKVARYGEVRSKLVGMQRKMAETTDLIMDGRDIGTVVLPNADAKIYLTASSIVRAKRRFLELQEKGVDCDLNQIEQDIIARDEQDMNREISPLRQAEDAILVDSSDMSIDEVVETIKKIVKDC